RRVARSKAWRGTDLGNRTALTATPVSITVRNSFAMQQLLQNVRGQAARGRVLTDFVHDRFEWPDRTGGQLAQAEAQKKLQLSAICIGRLPVSTRCVGVNLNRNSRC